jgi:predicted ATPase
MTARPREPLRQRSAGPGTKIRRLTPRGFLSFSPDFGGIELGALTVFVGANGSGKSNCFEAIRFLKESQRGAVGFLTSGSEVRDWVFDSAASARVELDATTGAGGQRYWLGVRSTGNGGFEFESEGLERLASVNKNVFWRQSPSAVDLFAPRPGTEAGSARVEKDEVEPTQTVLDAVRPPRGLDSQFRSMRTFLDSIEVFSERGLGKRLNPLRSPRGAGNVHGRLLDDGSNAALFLNTLLLRPGFRARLVEHLTEVLPGVDDVLVDSSMGASQVVLMERSRGRRTPASRLSDGTLHWLFLGLILLDAENEAPVFIDEPDLGLHPDAVVALVELLRTVSKHRQLVVTTHSKVFLDQLTDTPECVVAFDRDVQGTRTSRPTPTELRRLARGDSLGTAWTAGVFGGTRW